MYGGRYRRDTHAPIIPFSKSATPIPYDALYNDHLQRATVPTKENGMNTRAAATALGWFSIGLGLAELLAPRKMSRATGLNSREKLMPFLGAREITSGIGLLASQKPAGWLWSRVIGDAMDLAILGSGFRGSRGNSKRLAFASGMVAAVTAVDLLASRDATMEKKRSVAADGGGTQLFRTITIQKSAKELHAFWRHLENLPQIVPDLKSVTQTGERTSHWVARGPGGVDIEWDAEITEDQPAARISWRSLPGATVPNRGTVRFEELPGDRGCVVRLMMDYDPPAGGIGAKIARLFGKAPEQQTMEFLRKFKQLMETGEIATTVGQPAGRKTSISPKFDVAARRMAEAN
jgi:uncharacterized membrane protein